MMTARERTASSAGNHNLCIKFLIDTTCRLETGLTLSESAAKCVLIDSRFQPHVSELYAKRPRRDANPRAVAPRPFGLARLLDSEYALPLETPSYTRANIKHNSQIGTAGAQRQA